MIKTAHSILMDQVRGQELHPGEFRTVQNWIGLTRKIEDATYVPAAAEHVKPMMEDLVKFIQNPPRQIPVLVQCAMVHYQFEAIHPFADGNGRIGRLLMSVLLSQRRVLDQPLLYLSAYIEKHKEEYYSLLLEVSRKSEWETWIRFFLVAVITQTKAAATNIQQLLALKSTYEQKLNSKKVSHSIARITDYLFSNPIITIPGVSKYLGITYRPTKNAILTLKDMGILKEHGIGQKGRMYVAHEILSILR
jgi:Fic family protein